MKIAAFDFDGTLHHPGDPNGGFTPADLAAIQAWREAGHLAISATGRSRSALAYGMRGSGLTFDYQVLSNGASAATGDNRELIFGYTIVNDVSSRDLQFADGQWARAKGIDTFCPLGPWIETDLDCINLDDQKINAYLTHDGKREQKQDSNTDQMIVKMGDIIAEISQSYTLLPGDVITTGSPAGTAPMVPGDTIEIEIPGVGSLKNPIERA